MKRAARGLSALAALFLIGCDVCDCVTFQNDSETTLNVSWQLGRAREEPIDPLSPALGGRMGSPVRAGGKATAGRVAGAYTDIILRAYDSSGALVYCRRFTAAEYIKTSVSSPVSVKPGDLRCG